MDEALTGLFLLIVAFCAVQAITGTAVGEYCGRRRDTDARSDAFVGGFAGLIPSFAVLWAVGFVFWIGWL